MIAEDDEQIEEKPKKKIRTIWGKDFLDETSGHYHGTFKEGCWTATGLITGCGLMQLYGLSHCDYPDAEESLKRLKERLMEDATSDKWTGSHKLKCRSLIGTLGSSYYNFYPNKLTVLKKLGFKEIAEYDNESHLGMPGYDKKHSEQKLFILTWKKLKE